MRRRQKPYLGPVRRAIFFISVAACPDTAFITLAARDIQRQCYSIRTMLASYTYEAVLGTGHIRRDVYSGS